MHSHETECLNLAILSLLLLLFCCWLDTRSASTIVICYWNTHKPLPSAGSVLLLRSCMWTHTTHQGAEQPEEQTSGKCSPNIPLEAMIRLSSFFISYLFLNIVCYVYHAQSWICKGVWEYRPCIIHVCSLTKKSRGTQYCTSFLSFNFWILNACLNTGVLSHPMNVCKYAGVYIAASTGNTQKTILVPYLKVSGCEDF